MAGTRRLGRLLGVGRLLGITCSKTRARSAGLHAPVRRTGSFHREHWHNNRFNFSLSRIGRCIEIVKLHYLLPKIPSLFLNFLPCAREGSISDLRDTTTLEAPIAPDHGICQSDSSVTDKRAQTDEKCNLS